MNGSHDEDGAFDEVAARLGHTFGDPSLLRDALTHRSFVNERAKLAPRHNERLEFLGDAVIGLVVATLLAERFPLAPEGELTRRRADIVCEAALSALARQVAIGDALRLGRGEARTGGREKPRLLASALEACFGAIYLDGGIPRALEVGRALFADVLEGSAPGAADFKSRLQEWCQARGRLAPTYDLVRTAGPDHARRFTVRLVFPALPGSDAIPLPDDVGLAGGVEYEGEGRSKLEAEQGAARRALAAFEARETGA